MGKGTVRAFRAAGVRVAILDRAVEDGCALAAETGSTFFETDVLDEASVVAAFADARAAQGQERILVHTPGGGGLGLTAWRDTQDGRIHRHDFAQFSRIVSLNLNATFLCASVAAAGMMSLEPDDEGERGVIVMTSSTASQDGPKSTAAYAAAKSGLNGMTLSMARDLADEGIRINTILPGNFETPLIGGVPDEYKAQMRSWNLLPKRFGRPGEYASLVLELVQNRYMNAALVRIDAGARS